MLRNFTTTCRHCLPSYQTILVITFLLGINFIYAQSCDGTTVSKAFTSLGQARNVSSAGTYYFNINGETFSTYVDANGYVMVAHDFGNGSGDLPQVSSLTTAARGILSPSILAELDSTNQIRISHSGGTVDVTSTDSTLISRIINNTTLHQGVADNALNDSWTGTGDTYLTIDASSTTVYPTSLHQNIIDVSSSSSGFTWIPTNDNQRVIWSNGEIPDAESFTLWVQANTDALSNECTDTDNDGVIDEIDLDDDNDGILDTDEGCYNSYSGGDDQYLVGTPQKVQISYTFANSGSYTTANNNFNMTKIIASPASDITQLSANNVTMVWNAAGAVTLSDIAATTYAEAVINDEYLEFEFTTKASGFDYAAIDWLGFYNPNTSNPDFSVAFAISDDGGSSFTDLTSITEAAGSGASGAFPDGKINRDVSNYYIDQNTTYTVRIYPYDIGASSLVFDDLYLAFDVCASDSDGDGVPDHLDSDSDNDGISDLIEGGGTDTDGDGYVDYAVAGDPSTMVDVDGDGLADAIDNVDSGAGASEVTSGTALSNPDSDGDGVKDRVDLDSDNDGIPDNVEAQASTAYIAPSGTDTDGDGLDDVYDPDNGGSYVVPVNTDVADNPDYLDLDSNNDGLFDLAQSGMGVTDANVDGVADNTVGTNGLVNEAETGGTEGGYSDPTGVLSNTDPFGDLHDTDADYNGTTGEVDFRYREDFDNDGILDVVDLDDDNDGILDAIESPTCFYTESEIGIVGATTTLTNYNANAAYSFTELYDNVFNNLASYGVLNTAITGESVYELEMNFPIALDGITEYYNYSTFKTGATFKWQGFDGSSWIDVTDTLTATQATNGNITYTFTKNSADYSSYRVLGITGQTYYNRLYEFVPEYSNFISSAYPKDACNNDTDGDGNDNHQDLDSDGDGCYDVYESSVTGVTLSAGAYTDSLIVDPNVNDVGTNGLKDGLELVADTGIVSFTDTYNSYATSNFLNLCSDFDNDGIADIVDIDDDNDGIMDAVESPDCYYTANDVEFTAATTSLTNYSTNAAYSFTELYDSVFNDLASYGVLNTNIADEAVYELEMAFPVALDGITEYYNYSAFKTGATFKWQGFDGTNWVDVSDTLTATQGTNSSVTYPFTKNSGDYSSYRVLGITGQTYYNRLYEFVPEVTNFVASAYPKNACTSDTDGDGNYNHQDLDVDGDGCYDVYESLVTGATLSAGAYTDSLIVDPNVNDVGTNGLKDGLETIADTGIVNFADTYNNYATSDFLNLCSDFDNDGIADILDIDDDNDGIMDAVESPDCYYTSNDVEFTAATTSLTNYSTNAAYSFTELYDSVFNDLASYGVFNTNIADEAVYELEMAFPVALDGITEYYNYSAFKTGATFKWQGFDGTNWVDVSDTLTATQGTNSSVTYPFTKNSGDYSSYRVLGITGQTYYNRLYEFVPEVTNFVASAYPKNACTSDTDGDGNYNHQDLDADGDGCYDVYESSVTGATLSAGAYTDSLIVDPNVNDVGTNGLKDGLETIADTGIVNFADTYNNYATSDFLNLCSDFDSDGISDIYDIDDDNDGVLDALESPDCYYSADDVEFVGASTTLTNYNTNAAYSFTELYDDVLNDFAAYGVVNTAVTGEVVYELELAFPTQLSGIDVVHQYSIFKTGATFKWQGYDGSNWVDVTQTLTATSTTNATDTYTFTENPANYYKYRVLGISGLTNYNRMYEMVPLTDGFVSSLYPKTSCTADADSDGIYNNLDLDSDGDGCYDIVEANVTGNTVDQSVYTDSLIIDPSSPTVGVGTNGFADALETSADSDSANYTPTYTSYALSSGLNACSDSDSDGILDLFDLDADNDGIPNLIESEGCYYAASDFKAGDRSSFLTVSSELPMFSPQTIDMSIDSVYTDASNARFENSTSVAGAVVYQVAFPYPINLDDITFNYSGTYSSFQNAEIIVQGSNDLSTWTDLSSTVTYPANSGGEYVFDITQNAGEYYYYRLKGVSGATYTTGYFEAEFNVLESSYAPSNYPKASCTSDTDGDGYSNYLDLDSDGDGCYDIVEGNVTGATLSQGVYTDSLIIDPSAPTVGVGTNGYADALETSADADSMNFASSYSLYGIDASLNACEDTDGDGVTDVFDLDDDNDGILDAIESATCFYTEEEVDFTAASTTLTNYNTNVAYSFEELYDDVEDDLATYGVLNTAVAGETVYQLDLDFPAQIDGIEVVHNYSIFHNSSAFKWQAFDGLNWIDLTDTLTGVASANGTDTYSFTKNQGAYTSYRALGISGNTYYNRIYEINPLFNSFNSSFYPKAACISDLDSDGIPNHQDLDADGDGCYDSYEALVVNSTADGSVTDSITAGNYGINGYADTLETSTDSGITVDTLTYKYANNFDLNLCTDTDDDGVPDLLDLDDDNDGIPDKEEGAVCAENLVSDGGFNVAPTAATGWYLASSPYAAGATSPPWGTSWNLSLTGSYFEEAGGDNDASGGAINANINAGAVVYDIATLTAGDYIFAFDVEGHSPSMTTNPLLVEVWDATLGQSHEVLFNSTLNGFADYGNPQTVESAFTITDPTKDYLILFHSLGNGAQGMDYSIDRVLVSLDACQEVDTDGDGIPNHLDLDSDNDGISDIIEAGGTDTDGDGQVDYPTPGDVTTMTDLDGDGVADAYDDVDNGSGAGEVTSGTSLIPTDSDSDGFVNYLDLDSDNDGIPDNIEAQTSTGYITVSGNDTDGDGLDDAYDTDNGGTALDPVNTDGTDNPDYLDLDSDNDGLYDLAESGMGVTDANADGMADNSVGDNGLVNEAETGGLDQGYTDVSGILTDSDPLADLADNDFNFTGSAGEVDFRENLDTDGDGIPDSIDIDDDNDGILDVVEYQDPSSFTPPAGADTDGDGVDDAYDLDCTGSNCNGITGVSITPIDTDSDGIPDYLDLDSDGDGIPDNVEAQATDNYIAPTGVDADGDGLDDAYDILCSTCPATFQPSILKPLDTDGDGTPDYLDLDSDNDGETDLDESGLGYTDANADGMVDGTVGTNGIADEAETGGTDQAYTDPTGALDDTTPFGTLNNISISSTAEVDFREVYEDTDGDGVPDLIDIDDDNDGLLDADECGDPYNYLDWDVEKWNAETTDTTYTVNGDDITFQVEDLSGAMQANTPVSTNLVYQGGLSSAEENVVFAVDNPTFAYNEITITIDLGTSGVGLQDINFDIFDLDANLDSAYYRREILTVTGSLGGSTVLPNLTPGSGQQVYGNEFWGTAASPATGAGSDTGTGHVAFSGFVDQIILTFKVSKDSKTAVGGPGFGLHDIAYYGACDPDGDGLDNTKDVDSDDDGCPDAVEAGEDYSELELADPSTLYQYKGSVDAFGYPVNVNLGGSVNAGVYDVNTYGSINCESSFVLSVDLFAFKAEAQNMTSLLTWETLSEEENDHFEIFWRTDFNDWVKIGEVKGAGNSQEKILYDFVHPTPIIGNNYYKLVMVDFNGVRHVSDVEKVELLNSSCQFMLIPNPNQGSLVITSSTITAHTDLKVFDSQGRSVPVTIIQQNIGMIRLEHSLPRGSYVIYLPQTNEHIMMVVQ